MVAVTHDRYFLDNAAEWILELDRGHGIPWKGNYTSLAGAEGAAAGDRGQAGDGAHQGDEAGTRVGAPEPQGAPGQEQGAPGALRGAVDRYEYQKRNETQEIFIPVGERLGNEVIEFNDVSKGFGDRLLIDNLVVQRAAGRDRRHHRPQRRRQVDAVPHDHRQGEARLAARSRSARR
ncbi:MAG: hypothetical protein MZW92_44225 [Comamonadaceae bacterium]|nr:hypothetical protein [Comamonadaceae bacterium]